MEKPPLGLDRIGHEHGEGRHVDGDNSDCVFCLKRYVKSQDETIDRLSKSLRAHRQLVHFLTGD